MNKNLIISLILLLAFYSNNLLAFENKILLKIDNEIVTTIDIAKEIEYLKTINKEINTLEKNKIIEIAKNSIVRDKIKKISLEKIFEEFKVDEEYLNQLIVNKYRRIGFQDLDSFKKYLNQNNVKYEKIREKMIIDAMWSEFIYAKYKDNIKIDRNKIAEEMTQKKNKNYLLSEIIFNGIDKKELETNYNNILKTIKENGFENAALIHSTSQSAENGGKLGWIKEASLSKIILNEISKLKKGDYTSPIKIPGGFIILKINDYKEESISENVEEEINKIIKIKTNEQLNQYSNIYFNKIKKDIVIYER